MSRYAGKRVTVMGLGRFGGGVGVTRWLAKQGAIVTVSDKAPTEALVDSVKQLAGLNVALHLGGHDEADFRETELLVVSPAVPKDHPMLAVAREAGVAVSSEMNLFLAHCRGRVVGVTGTAGKSTTTAMIETAMGPTLGSARVWVGGNIGISLLEDLEAIGADDWVVLELSSFQLEDMATLRCSPEIAVITSLFPNHLDRHGTMAAYTQAKLNIARFQNPQMDHLLICDGDERLAEAVRGMRGSTAGVWRYGLDDEGGLQLLCDDGGVSLPSPDLVVPGRHNRVNAAAALSVVRLCGGDVEDAAARLQHFQGLPHRLMLVGEFGGVRYYNDSKSTTPEATLTAMAAFEQPLIVLAGGYDKGVSLDAMARALAGRAKGVVCYGKTGPTIAAAMRSAAALASKQPTMVEANGFDDAVASACGMAVAGDVLLLSPGCASWDMFDNYEQRGDRFTELVKWRCVG